MFSLSIYLINILQLLFIAALSIGLGKLLDIKSNKTSLPIQMIAGFSLITPLVFLASLIFPQDLYKPFLIVTIIGFVGLTASIVRFPRQLGQLKFDKNISSTLWIGFSIATILFTVAQYSHINLQPKFWDEFSHWATQPHQYFKFNSFYSKEFTQNTTIAYIPGLLINSMFFNFLFKNEGLNFAFYMTGYFFNFVCLLVSGYLLAVKKFKFSPVKIVIILALLTGFSEFFVPFNLLIENAQRVHLVTFFALLLYFTPDQVSTTTTSDELHTPWLHLFVIAAFGFFLKTPHYILTWIFILFFISSQKFSKKSFCQAALLVAVAVAIKFLWSFVLARSGYSPMNSSKEIGELIRLATERKHLIVAFATKVIQYSGFLAGLLLTLLTFKSLPKAFRRSLFTYVILFSIGLLGLFLFIFGDYEANILASFDRYFSLPMIALNASLAFVIIHKIPDRFLKIPTLASLVLFVLLLMGLGSEIQKLQKRSESTEYNAILKNVYKVHDIGVSNNWKYQNVIGIDQGANNIISVILGYTGSVYRQSNYNISVASSFGPTIDNVWRQQISDNDFQNMLTKFDTLILYKTDEWMTEMLYKKYPHCKNIEAPYFIYSGIQPAYCVSLKN